MAVRGLQLVAMLLYCHAGRSEIRFQVLEEQPAGSALGSVAEALALTPRQLRERGFRLLPPVSFSSPPGRARPLVHLREATGELVALVRLDREALCPAAAPSPSRRAAVVPAGGGRASGGSSCTVTLDAVMERPRRSALRVVLEILDVNDNEPTFESRTQRDDGDGADDGGSDGEGGGCARISVLESAGPGTRFALPAAHDPDVGPNASLRYALHNASDTFSLRVSRDDDDEEAGDDEGGDYGTDGFPELVLRRPLDRESQAEYRLLLTATDGGAPVRVASCGVTVRVLDANDNAPTFERAHYHVEVREDAAAGTEVARVRAIDPDEGTNGRIAYALSRHAGERARRLFSVDAVSGSVRLAAPLDRERRAVEELYVEARDMGPGGVAAHCKVTVGVIDDNDNAPAIVVSALLSGGDGVGGGGPAVSAVSGVVVVSVAESRPPGSFVAFVRVADGDAGDNGRVACELLGAGPFALRPSSENVFALVTSDALDRERVESYDATVAARDSGRPPLSAAVQIRVLVADENDNAPRFAAPAYRAAVPENGAADASILAVSAADADAGENGRVSYSIGAGAAGGTPAAALVSIDERSGVLRALRPFDHEKVQELRFEVVAIDHGAPPLSATATVTVTVLDRNDNAPAVTRPRLRRGNATVYALRSTPAGARLVRIQAVDEDPGDNGRLAFRLLRGNELGLFHLDRDTGELATTRDLAEDERENHELLLEVRDHGAPSLSSLATLRVIISDVVPAHFYTEGDDDDGEDDAQAGGVFMGLPLILIVALACVCSVLLVTMVVVAVVCKRENKEMRTYNCRAAETTYCRKPQKTGGGGAAGGPSAAAADASGNGAPPDVMLGLGVRASLERLSRLLAETSTLGGRGETPADITREHAWMAADETELLSPCCPALGGGATRQSMQTFRCWDEATSAAAVAAAASARYSVPAMSGSEHRLKFPTDAFRRVCTDADGISGKDSGRGSDPRDSDAGDADSDPGAVTATAGARVAPPPNAATTRGPSTAGVPTARPPSTGPLCSSRPLYPDLAQRKALTPTWELMRRRDARCLCPTPPSVSAAATPGGSPAQRRRHQHAGGATAGGGDGRRRRMAVSHQDVSASSPRNPQQHSSYGSNNYQQQQLQEDLLPMPRHHGTRYHHVKRANSGPERRSLVNPAAPEMDRFIGECIQAYSSGTLADSSKASAAPRRSSSSSSSSDDEGDARGSRGVRFYRGATGGVEPARGSARAAQDAPV